MDFRENFISNKPETLSKNEKRNLLLGILTCSILTDGLIDTNKKYILQDTNEYRIIGISEHSVIGNLFSPNKRDFKSITIKRNSDNLELAIWNSNSGAQHIGLGKRELNSYNGDSDICWGPKDWANTSYECYNDIRLNALKTKKGKQFTSQLEKEN
jgi:hypothetical protein